MGANQTWVVLVLKLVDDEVEIGAVTKDEAMEQAKAKFGVAHVIDAYPKYNEAYPNHPRYRP